MEYIKSYFQLYDFVSGRTIFQKRCFLTEDVSMEALKTNVYQWMWMARQRGREMTYTLWVHAYAPERDGQPVC